MIDEFQDINRIQFDVMKMLAGERGNLFVVGDDDQSIYRFRGAKPEIMLHFKEDFPEAKMVLLDTNYRSQGHIVTQSLNLIGHNRERFEKRIRAAKEPQDAVERAELFRFCSAFPHQHTAKALDGAAVGVQHSLPHQRPDSQSL